MGSQEDIDKTIETEISQAKDGAIRYQIFHILLVSSTIITGAATTFVTGTDIVTANWVAPLLAAITTGFGAIANQTGFKKKSNGYRLSKTEFQNLKLDRLKVNPEYEGDALIDKIRQIRSQKIARTTEEG